MLKFVGTNPSQAQSREGSETPHVELNQVFGREIIWKYDNHLSQFSLNRERFTMKRINHYVVFAFSTLMEATFCPQCQGEIELGSLASGTFECPHCGRELILNAPGDDSTMAKLGSWFFHMARLSVTPLPLMWALVLLPISLLVGFVMIILSGNFFILGSGLGSWMLEELTKFDFSDGVELFFAVIFVIALSPFGFLAFLIALLLGFLGLAIMATAIVRLIPR